MNIVEKQTLSFYTTGESFTALLKDYFQSGLFSLYEKLLNDNLNDEQMKEAFRLRISFEGDTREEGLFCNFATSDPEDFPETLYYAIRTISRGVLNEQTIELEWMAKENKDLAVLLKYFTTKEILNLCQIPILNEEGYSITEYPTSNEHTINGVILKDGRFIECGYQDHVNLYPILYNIGLSDDGRWSDSKEVMHISSSQLNGLAAYRLRDRLREDYVPQAQIDTLWRLRNHLSGLYGYSSDNTCIPNLIRNHVINIEKQGGKWGNLSFLKKYYPHINTPKTSLTIEDFSQQAFMRTSPKKSLPGLLNSRLINSYEEVEHARIFMEQEFEKFKDLNRGNELHWFFQEFLEGSNGVCHIKYEPNLSDTKYLFNYQLSLNQGDVVKGKTSHEKLSEELEKELEQIGVELFTDLKESIQLEFCKKNLKLITKTLQKMKLLTVLLFTLTVSCTERRDTDIEGCQYIESTSFTGNGPVETLVHKGNCTNPIHYIKRDTILIDTSKRTQK